MGGVRAGRGRDACTGSGRFAPLKNATWGNGSARCKSARTSASFMRPRRICCPSTAPCLAKPGHGTAPAPVADCRLCHPGLCRPGAASSHRLPPRHRQFAPPAHPTRYYQTTRPGVPPANSETPRPPNGRRGVNTQRGVSARRLTRQLRKSPRPQRRHLRYRLLARPLRERQRPQEQQRG